MNSWNEIEGEIEAAEIVMIAELPVLQLKHVQSALLPQEGCWKWIEGWDGMMKLGQRRLMKMAPRDAHLYRVAVSEEARQLALVRRDSKQKRLPFCGGGAKPPEPIQGTSWEEEQGSTALNDADISESRQRSAQALAAGEKIRTAYRGGQLACAEDAVAMLQESEDPAATIAFLYESGKKELTVASGGRRFESGGGDRFPQTFESKVRFLVVLQQFTDLNLDHLTCRVASAKVKGDPRNLLAWKYIKNSPIKLEMTVEREAAWMVQAGLADCRVEAVVTVSVNMKQQAVTSMTLVEVLKKDQLVERINAQNLKPLQMSIVWETDSERDAGQSL